MNNTKEEILASLAKKDELEKRAKNLSMDDVEHLLKEQEKNIRSEYTSFDKQFSGEQKKPEYKFNDSPTITKKNAALEVSRYLFEKRSMGLIITIGSFGVYIAAINPKLKMIITIAFIGLGIYNLVTAQMKLQQLNKKYDLNLKLDFKKEATKWAMYLILKKQN